MLPSLDTIVSLAGWQCASTTIKYFNAGSTESVAEIYFYSRERSARATVTFGTGQLLAHIANKITSIVIKQRDAGDHQLKLTRAYKLSYGESPFTSQELLKKVQEFGSDATLDGENVITGGTALPPYEMVYSESPNQEGGPGFNNEAWPLAPSPCYGGTWSTADLNGDQKMDIWTSSTTTVQGEMSTKLCIRHSTGTGFGPASEVTVGASEFTGGEVIGTEAFDVDGDFADDVVLKKKYRVITNPGSNHEEHTEIGWFRAGGAEFLHGDWNFRQIGDFNGDGRQDAIVRGTGALGAAMFLGNGTGLIPAANWTNFPETWSTITPAFTRQVQSGDFNGDGRTDLIDMWIDGGDWKGKLYLSTGNDFATTVTASVPFDQNFLHACWLVGDVNGDGLSDVVAVDPQHSDNLNRYRIRRLLSLGHKLDESNFVSPDYDSYFPGFPRVEAECKAQKTVIARDFNGDGRMDLMLRGTANGEGETAYQFLVSHGKVFIDTDVEIHSRDEGGYYRSEWVADFDGDGLPDFFDGSDGLNMRRSDGVVPDLLNSITIPSGGKEIVRYMSSSQTENPRIPFNMKVVEKTTVDDGRGSQSATEYFYTDAKWSKDERQFMGFRIVKAELPCASAAEGTNTAGAGTTCAVQRTTYSQTAGCLGRLEFLGNHDGDGDRLAYRDEVYETSTRVPYECRNVMTINGTTVGATTKTTRIDRTFGHFGNIATETYRGDTAASGDETHTVNSYTSNEEDFVVGCKKEEKVFPGTSPINAVGPSGTLIEVLLSHVKTSYIEPGATESADCRPRRIEKELSTGQWAVTTNTYDQYGNLTGTVDPVGNTTNYSYDPLNLYIATTTLPAADPVGAPNVRFTTSSTWNYLCGAPATATDINGNSTSYLYDVLCRPTEVDLPGGNYTKTSYADFGNPVAQYVETRVRAPGDAPSEIWSREYLDGLGRSYATVKQGPATSGNDATIRVERSFNPRGYVAYETLPFYRTALPTGFYPVLSITEQAVIPAITYAYDKLDRMVKINNADGSFTTLSYNIGSGLETTNVAVTDEVGRLQSFGFDGGGKLTRRTKASGLTFVTTSYARDGLGRIVGVTDPVGNKWTYTFDLGGRRSEVKDPDLGLWKYGYDVASRLVRQEDARGVVTTLIYDGMSRVKTKQVAGAGLATETTSNAYDDIAGNGHGGYANRGLLTDATRVVAAQSIANIAIPAVDVTRRFDYDVAGRLVRDRHISVAGEDRTLGAEYYASGAIRRKLLADGTWTGLSLYDPAGRLRQLDNAAVASTTEPELFIADLVYNAAGQAERVTYGNGMAVSYGYSATRGFLMSARTTGASPGLDLAYTRLGNGQISAIAAKDASGAPDATRSWSYGYDGFGRLVSATNTGLSTETRTYAYDLADNMTRNAGLCAANPNLAYPAAPSLFNGFTSIRPHAPTMICGVAVTYDPNGNTLSYDGDGTGTATGPRTLIYDGENRPIAITTNGLTSVFAYGPDGERVMKRSTLPSASSVYLLTRPASSVACTVVESVEAAVPRR